MTLAEAANEYCASQHFLFLESKVKGHAEELLSHWCETVDTPLDYDILEESVRDIGMLNLPVEVKRAFPNLLDAFFKYLATTASFPDAGLWQDYLAEVSITFTDSIRHDGSMRGKTVTRALKVGRNDPCPCGSGKKYKRCCG